jgi:hypothetical protein
MLPRNRSALLSRRRCRKLSTPRFAPSSHRPGRCAPFAQLAACSAAARLSASDTTSKRVRRVGHSASNIRAQHALPPALARTARIAPSARADSPSPCQVRRARARAAPATSMLTHQQVGSAATTARTAQRASATPAAPRTITLPRQRHPLTHQQVESAAAAAAAPATQQRRRAGSFIAKLRQQRCAAQPAHQPQHRR